MVIVWGQRMYGRVDKNAGSYLATRFFHIYYLPLIPLASWLVFEDHGEGAFTGVQVKMQWRSVIAAWLRVFGTAYVLFTGFALLSVLGHVASLTTMLSSIATFTVVAGLVGFAWFKLGKLSASDVLARTAYYEHVGRFVDPALLDEQRSAIKASATEALDKHLVRHASGTYRDAPQAQWKEIATRPDMREVPLLNAALTRCRIEAVEATGAERAALDKTHAQILANLAAASATPVAA